MTLFNRKTGFALAASAAVVLGMSACSSTSSSPSTQNDEVAGGSFSACASVTKDGAQVQQIAAPGCNVAVGANKAATMAAASVDGTITTVTNTSSNANCYMLDTELKPNQAVQVNDPVSATDNPLIFTSDSGCTVAVGFTS